MCFLLIPEEDHEPKLVGLIKLFCILQVVLGLFDIFKIFLSPMLLGNW